jgi:hypothetical protein
VLEARLCVLPRPTQASILATFVGFQGLDALTTHVGLGLRHRELNWVMAPVMTLHGELAAYAVKGIAVAVLLAVLMLLQHRKPLVWHAYRVAAGLSAVAVLANTLQLL